MGRLVNVTWMGPSRDDDDITADLPEVLLQVLATVNGCIQFHGGFHIRGACRNPPWHSLRDAWYGPEALYRSHNAMSESDIPFAEDFLGNQFIVRQDKVLRISGETGSFISPLDCVTIDSDVNVAPIEMPLEIFIAAMNEMPNALGLEILDGFMGRGGSLQPGEMLQIYPPLCSIEAKMRGFTVKVVSISEGLKFLATKVRPKVTATARSEAISFPLVR